MAANVELHVKPEAEFIDDPKVDVFTQRPRTPNTQYSRLTDTQIRNTKKDATPFFHHSTGEDPKAGAGTLFPRQYRNRFVAVTSKHSLRGPTGTHDFCWIGDQVMRDPPAEHNSSRAGAFLSWGVDKVGQRTERHFTGERRSDFTEIDCYRRPPTNQPGPIIMKYGRPNDGYYSQRFPSSTTWFGASCELNKTGILQNIHERTTAEYEKERAEQYNRTAARVGKYPEFSEYVDRFQQRNRQQGRMTRSPLVQ